MSFAKKVVVGINLGEPLTEQLTALKELEFLNESEVHFLSINQTTTYAIGLGESAIIYPLEDDQRKIRTSAMIELRKITRNLLPQNFNGNIIIECIFGDDPKTRFCEYVEEHHIDTIIVAARESRGFFEGSFTQYVSKHSKANMIILKHAV